MKRLLRSVIDVDGQISQEHLQNNWSKLLAAEPEWQRPDDQRIFDFLRAFFAQRLELPSIQTLRDYFAKVGDNGDLEVEERLKDIDAAPWYIRTNFAHLLDGLLKEQRTVKAAALLRETQDIVTKGVDIIEPGSRRKVRKHGVEDGYLHVIREFPALLPHKSSARTSGELHRDAPAVLAEYERAKRDGAGLGKLMGVNSIDTVCHGIKNGELWVHAAFPGHLKTSMALNWAYNLVTRYRTNVLFYSLEMTYEQLRRQFAVLHTASAKFKRLGRSPLDNRAVREGQLPKSEEEFLREAIEDLATNAEHCELELRCPDRRTTIEDIRIEAERVQRVMDIGLVVIDHGQLVAPAQRRSDYVVELNDVVRDAKQLALHFNGGEKIPVLLLWQINRQGHEEAVKNQGRYKATALAYANEVEKSADVITTTFLDDARRAAGTTLFTNLKNRENALFAPFEADVHFPSRRIDQLRIVTGREIEDVGI